MRLLRILKEVPKPLLFSLLKKGIGKKRINRSLFKPNMVSFNITDNCNSKCITCNAWKKHSTNELTTEEVLDILEQIAELGIKHVGFVGGEPLLRSDLEQFIVKSRELGFESISILSNGLALTKERAEKLLEAGLTDVGLSIDGINEVQDEIRGIPGYFKRSLSALNTVYELKKTKYPKLNIKVSTTLMKPSLDQIETILELCRRFEASIAFNLIDTKPYFFKGVDATQFLIKDQEELDKLIDKLHKIKKREPNLIEPWQNHESLEYARKYFINSFRKDIGCVTGHLSIALGPHGEIYSGCWVLPPIGNLRKQKLKDVIYSEAYMQRLYDMYHKKCPGCSCGYATNVTYDLKSLFKEITWKLKWLR